jgi:RimJ/RimL family protein N-acetyltransferase
VNDDTLVTSRLRLVPLGPADADTLERHWNCPEVNMVLFYGDPVPRDVIDEQLEISELDFESDGFGLWRIEAGDVPCVGVVGLRQAAWRNTIELVFSVEEPWWGHGYATEAVQAVLEHAMKVVELREVVSLCYPHSHAALRVLSRAGMKPVGEARLGEDRLSIFIIR